MFQFEFLRQISAIPTNTVIGLVRDKAATQRKVSEELNRPNIHIIEADLTDYDSLKVSRRCSLWEAINLYHTQKSVNEVSPIVNGTLDYVLANAGIISSWSAYDSLGALYVYLAASIRSNVS